LLALAPGGALLATNHAPSVQLEDWLELCERCAAKAGRPLACPPEVIEPDADFPPAPPEGRAAAALGAEDGGGAGLAPTHLLKMAVLRVE
jgi:hypothetical protein